MRTSRTVVMMVFIVMTLVLGISNFKHPMKIRPMAETIISTWALFRTKGLKNRYLVWFATDCWTIYNIGWVLSAAA